VNSLAHRYWDEVATDWRQRPRDRLWRAHCDAVNRRWLARHLPAEPVRRLLKTDLFDEAVGTGFDDLLRSRAAMVVGADLSLDTLGAARARRARCQLVGGDARAWPFGTGVFDVVVSTSTLDHFRTHAELAGAVREIHRVLRPGGQLLLTLDNPANPLVGLRNLLPFTLLNRLGIVPYYVGATWGPRRLRATLQAVGFEVQEITALLHCLRVGAVRVARWVERHGSPATQERFLRELMRQETPARWPTRFLTGHFIAVRARRAPASYPP
jgi:SAM-dependent methyltransferase